MREEDELEAHRLSDLINERIRVGKPVRFTDARALDLLLFDGNNYCQGLDYEVEPLIERLRSASAGLVPGVPRRWAKENVRRFVRLWPRANTGEGAATLIELAKRVSRQLREWERIERNALEWDQIQRGRTAYAAQVGVAVLDRKVE